MRSGAERSLSRCSPRSLQLELDELCGRGRDEHLPAVAGRRDAGGAVHVVSDVALLGDEWRPGVQADAHVDRGRATRDSVSARAAARAPGAVGKAKKKASPCVSTSTPPSAAHASRMIRRCSASASAYASAPSSCRSFVEPSTSVKRKVTVPVGRSSRTPRDHPPAELASSRGQLGREDHSLSECSGMSLEGPCASGLFFPTLEAVTPTVPDFSL